MSDRRDTPPSAGGSPGASILYALIIGFLLFLLLPLTQLITETAGRDNIRITDAVLPPPPPPPPEREEEEEEVEEEKVEELQEEPPPPTLEQLELALSTDIGAELGGGFQLPQFNVAQQLEEMIFSVSELDQTPVVRKQITPRYPPSLKRAGIEGEVRVRFIVNEQGDVREVTIVRSDNPAFNEPTLDAMRRWKFEPGTVGGKPVVFTLILPFEFTIN